MRTKLRSKFSLLFMTFAVIMLVFPAMALAQDASDSTGTSVPAPTIQSDKEDYPPGDTVILTGSNWQPGETVNINVNDDEGQTWNRNVDVIADENGDVRDEFVLPDWFVAKYIVKATGSSGAIATTTFTDAALPSRGCPGPPNSPIVVNTTADQFDAPATAPGPGGCSLREAISAANSDSNTADTIILPAGTYTLTRTSGGGEIGNGDLDITQPLTINGAGARTTIIQAGTNNSNGIDRVLHHASSGSLTLSGATVQFGRVTNGPGGGILSEGGSMTLSDVTIANNSVTNGNDGGGIYSTRPLTINRATISGNSAGSNSSADGGGLYSTGETKNLTNVTITNNSSTGSSSGASNGGGGFRIDGGETTFTNVTVSHNSAPTGSNILKTGGTLNLRNTVVSDGTGGGANCAGSGTIGNIANNLDSGTSCGFGSTNGSKSSANANLGGLQDNGGPTDTRALGSGSDAIDAGTNNSAPNVDQRNIPRPQPQGGNHDIGAFELEVQTYQLSVAKAGAGSGTVTSNPAGINCGSDCSESYHAGTSVTLTATANSGSTFNDWSGGDGTKNDNGTYTVTMSAARSVTATFKADQTITFTSAAPSNAVVGDTYKPTATGGGSGNPVTFGASGACSYDSGTGLVTMDSAGSCTVTADQEGNADYNAASQASQAFSVGKRPTAISDVSGSGTFGGNATLTAKLTSGANNLSGKTISFKLDNSNAGTANTNASGVATLTGVSLAGIDAGSYTNAVKADFDGDSTYQASSGQGDLTVAKAAGSVTINNIPSNATVGDSFTPTYTKDGDGTPSTTSNTPSICSVSGGVVSFDVAGTCKLQASVTEGTNHRAATGAEQTFTISKHATAISDVSGSATFGGNATLTATLKSGTTALSGKSVEFKLDGVSKGTATINAAGVATLTGVSLSGINAGSYPGAVSASFAEEANYNGSSGSGNLTVAKANPQISWNNPADIVYGTALSSTQLNATATGVTGASLAGSFEYTPPAGTVLNAGQQQILSVKFTPTDATNYNEVTTDVKINVLKANTSITDVSGSGTFGGNATLTAKLSFGSYGLGGKSVEFKLNGVSKGTATTNAQGVATLTGVSLSDINAGTHTNAVSASFAEEANYNGSSGSGNLTVAKAAGSVTINNIPSNAVFGGSFTPDYTRAGDGVASTTSKTTNVCSVNSSGVVSFNAVGTCTLQASVTEGTNHLAATGAQQSFTIGQAPTTSNVSVSPNSQQYSDKVDLVATLSPASISGFAPATGVKFYIGPRLVGTAQLAANNGQLSATLSNVVLTEAPNPPNTPPYLVTVQFTDVNSNFNVNNATAPLTVTKENATTDYTGSLFVSTSGSSSSKATVNLAATIRDITAVNPATDPDGGDIRKATIEFVLSNIGGAVVAKCSPTIGLVGASDTKTGTATCSVPVDIGSADSIPYTVNMTIGGHYGAPANPTVVTVSKPLAGMITGGGFLVNESSAGLTAGATGQKSNFGFNVKPNKSGTSLQGNINTIVRNGGKVYQVKGNSMTSLVTNLTTKTAIFEGKANIQDVTDPLNPISIDGNATLRVTMTDKGEPGSSDSIGITVWNKNGGLWFSSRWNGTNTVEQVLSGGNLVVR